jgi:hypothetical protein
VDGSPALWVVRAACLPLPDGHCMQKYAGCTHIGRLSSLHPHHAMHVTEFRGRPHVRMMLFRCFEPGSTKSLIAHTPPRSAYAGSGWLTHNATA